MARRSNYTYEKRQKEIRKQKKKEAKDLKKKLRKEATAAGLEDVHEMDIEQLEAAIQRATGSGDDEDWDEEDYDGDDEEE